MGQVHGSAVRLVPPDEARRIVGGLSLSTIDRLRKAGQFPAPVVLNRNRHDKPVRIAYVLGELEAWVLERIAADRGAA